MDEQTEIKSETTEKQTLSQSEEQQQDKHNEKLEFTYDDHAKKTSKALFLGVTLAEIILFAIALYFTATYVDESSGDTWITLWTVFIMLIPFWIFCGVYYSGRKRWSFNIDGNYISYCPCHKRIQEMRIKDISVIEITKSKIIMKNQYGETVLKENLMSMPGGIQILNAMKEHNIPIEFLPGTEEIKKEVTETLELYDTYEKTGKLSVPWHKEGIEYAQEPESVERNHIESKEKRYAKLMSIISAVYFVLFIVLCLVCKRNLFLLIFGLYLLIFSLLTGIHTLSMTKLEQRIRSEGQRVTATVKEYRSEYEKNNVKLYPIFEFERSDGIHIAEGIVADAQVKLKMLGHFINDEYQIYYAPMLSSKVSYATDDEFIKLKKKRNIFVAISMAVTLAIAIFGGFITYQGYMDDSYRDAGTAIKITYDKKYHASNYTQDDVDGKTVKWICATCGIYNYVNDLDSTKLGGAAPNTAKARSLGRMIADGWKITNRKTAIDAINGLLEGGHRQGYHKIVAKLKKEGLTDMSVSEATEKINEKHWDDEKKQRYIASLTAYSDFGDKGLDAWDYCRTIQILGDCYQSGYISLEECLNQALPIALLIQSEYDSWEDMNQSYLYGYWYYSKTDPNTRCTDSYYRNLAYQELQKDFRNPFKKNKFEYRLKNTWSNIRGENE